MLFSRFGRVLVVLALFAVGIPLLWADMPNAACQYPFAFSGARVNVIILPYTANPDYAEVAGQLTLAMQHTILFSALNYRSIGVVRMNGPSFSLGSRLATYSAECDVNVVEKKLLGEAKTREDTEEPHLLPTDRRIPRGGAAIFLWGRMYKEGGRMYLASYARLLEPKEGVTLSVPVTRTGALIGKLPAEQIAFPPRTITTATVSQIEAAFAKTRLLHSAKSLNSPASPLPVDAENEFAYQVPESSSDGWMHFVGGNGAPSGWIHVADALRSGSLAAELPELRFVDGAIGYLEGLVAPQPSSLMSRARSSLEAFTQQPLTGGATLTIATAKAMLASILAHDSTTLLVGHQMARQAVALAPYNADARNLELIYRIRMGDRRMYQPSQWRSFADELTRAAALGPDKRYILNNLDLLYGQMLTSPALANGTILSEIRRRRAQVTRLRLPQ